MLRMYSKNEGLYVLDDFTLKSRYSSSLNGFYDFSRDRINGWAIDTSNPADKNLKILVVRGNEIIAVTNVGERSASVGWLFAIETGSLVNESDILFEHVKVLVYSNTDGPQALQLESSTKLQLIRELLPASATPFLEIDFGENGNSNLFVQDGWSGQEKVHRWTDGIQSSLAITAPVDNRNYTLHFVLWPFIVQGKLNEQRLRVLVNGIEIGYFSVTHQSYLQCSMPAELVSNKTHLHVCFLHPDAETPAHFAINNDTRSLALAFKKVSLFVIE